MANERFKYQRIFILRISAMDHARHLIRGRYRKYKSAEIQGGEVKFKLKNLAKMSWCQEPPVGVSEDLGPKLRHAQIITAFIDCTMLLLLISCRRRLDKLTGLFYYIFIRKGPP